MIDSRSSLNAHNSNYSMLNSNINKMASCESAFDFESIYNIETFSKDCKKPEDLSVIGAARVSYNMKTVHKRIKEMIKEIFEEMIRKKLPAHYDKFEKLKEDILTYSSSEDLVKFYESGKSDDKISMIEGLQKLLETADFLSQEDLEYFNSLLSKLKEQLLKEASEQILQEISQYMEENTKEEQVEQSLS